MVSMRDKRALGILSARPRAVVNEAVKELIMGSRL